jgi:RNA polymerase sigma factor (sigma-70 family)
VAEPSEDELDEWMARLARGERDAFDPLFRALYPRALRLARVRLPEDQAADLAQAILTKVFFRAADFDVERPALPWFYGIAAFELRTHCRRADTARRRQADASVAEGLAASGDPEGLLLERELRSCLQSALMALDDDSAHAIASMLGERARPPIGELAFRKRVSRAYARLRLLFGGFDGD